MKIAVGGVGKERIGGDIAVESRLVAADPSVDEAGSAQNGVSTFLG